MEELINSYIILSDTDFRLKCKEQNMTIGPLNKTTKKLYAKKLARIVSEKGGNVTAESQKPKQEIITEEKIKTKADGKFYAVRSDNDQLILDNKTDFLKYLKENKKSDPRFGIFESEEIAKLFIKGDSKTPKKLRTNFTAQGSNESPLRKPRAQMEKQFKGELKLAFSEPTQPHLNKIAKEITSHKDEAYNTIIEEIMKNPRILMTKSEYPVPFQPGTWGNIVHLCCRNNSPRILSAILAFISDSTFMNQLYPEITSKDEIQQKLDRNRQNYLYMPQYGPKQTMHARGDTPLHIATRHLSIEIIKLFSTFPEIGDLRNQRNHESLLPIELINPEDSKEAKECFHLLQEKVLLAILTSDGLYTDTITAPKLITTSDSEKCELLNSPNIRAIAGPMSKNIADDIRNNVTPKRARGMRFTQSEKIRRVRLTNPGKGIEDMCRPLCLQNSVAIMERWGFLDGGFLDLQSDEAFLQIENHLQEENDKENDLNSTIDILSELIGGLDIKESKKFLNSDVPSRADSDLYTAIRALDKDEKHIKQRLAKYPQLLLWFQRIGGYSLDERRSWKTILAACRRTKSSGNTPKSFNPRPISPSPRSISPVRNLKPNEQTRKKLFFD